jgi:hypothetical protein
LFISFSFFCFIFFLVGRQLVKIKIKIERESMGRSLKAQILKKLRRTLREKHELKREAHEARKQYRRLVREQRALSPRHSPHYSQTPHFSPGKSPRKSPRKSPDVTFASTPTEAEWKEARQKAVEPAPKEKKIPDVGAFLKARASRAKAAREKDGTAINAPNFVFNHAGKEIFATIAGGRNYKGKFQFQVFEIDKLDGEKDLVYDDLGWFDADALIKSTAGTPMGAWCADQVARNCKADSYPEGAHDQKRKDFVYVQATLTKK